MAVGWNPVAPGRWYNKEGDRWNHDPNATPKDLANEFGNEIGIKKSSAQITDNYNSSNLLNKQIIAVVNFRPRQIGPFISEVLTLGVSDKQGNIILLSPDKNVDEGEKLH